MDLVKYAFVIIRIRGYEKYRNLNSEPNPGTHNTHGQRGWANY